MKNLFYRLPQHLVDSFSGYFFYFHFLAWVVTYMLVISGFDWTYFLFTQTPLIRIVFFPAIIIGGLLPILLPLILIVYGTTAKKYTTLIIGAAIGQAAFLGWLVSSIYKTFTGRLQPHLSNLTVDISQAFQFGFWKNGIFWGWPSSHTTVAFAMAFALIYLYPKNKIIRYLASLYALYIGIGVSTNIHWFSDFVAGALIGTTIGIVVGKGFKKLLS